MVTCGMTAQHHDHVWPPQPAATAPQPWRSMALPLVLAGIGAALAASAASAWRASRENEQDVEETTRRRLGHTGRHVVPSAADIHVKSL